MVEWGGRPQQPLSAVPTSILQKLLLQRSGPGFIPADFSWLDVLSKVPVLAPERILGDACCKKENQP